MIANTISKAYMLGAFHDGTYNSHHKTFRFCQKEKEWLEMLQNCLESIGSKSWMYKEGKTRNLFVLETTASFLHDQFSFAKSSTEEQIAYIRGYFDAEGGIPQKMDSRYYIQLCQNNEQELTDIKVALEQMDIKCGKIHNPSHKVDSEYFRFYILSESHKRFMDKIGSWHPRKSKIFDLRMKI
jgi:hypothetical protein